MSWGTLFNLGLQHWQAVLLALVPALITLVSIVYFWKFPSYQINKVYRLYLFCIFVWQINDCMSRMSLSEETASSWDRLLVFGWLLQFPSSLHFILLLVGKRKMANSSWFLLAFYFPAVLVAIMLCSGIIIQPFVYSPFWGWIQTFNNSDPLLIVPVIWVSILVITCMLPLAILAYKNRRSVDYKLVTLLIFIGYFIPAVQGLITQIIFPLLLHKDPIPITSTLMVSIVLVVFGIKAYRIFSLSESLTTEHLTEIIQENIFAVTQQRAVTYINSYGAAMMNIKGKEKIQVKDLFPGNEETYKAFEKRVLLPAFQKRRSAYFQFALKNKEGKEEFWDITTYPILNRSSLNGLLIMCRDSTARVLLADARLAALRAQMNPHFIFNSLNSIQHYIHNYQREEAESFLSAFSKLIRQILDNSGKLFIPLSDELYMIILFLKLEKARLSDQLEYQILVDEGIDIDNIMIPSMLIQPYIENAIIHGLAPKLKGGKITVQIKKDSDIILCIIEDNGVGRQLVSNAGKNEQMKSKSYGMKISQDRLEILNNHLNISASVKVEDLYDQDKVPCGTRVIINMPLNEMF